MRSARKSSRKSFPAGAAADAGSPSQRVRPPEPLAVADDIEREAIANKVVLPHVRTIAPSFGTMLVALKNGQVLTGVKVAETVTTLTLADNQGHKHLLAKADIEEQQPSPFSTMPEGLEKRFTENEFIDLIAYLMSQK